MLTVTLTRKGALGVSVTASASRTLTGVRGQARIRAAVLRLRLKCHLHSPLLLLKGKEGRVGLRRNRGVSGEMGGIFC